MDFLLWNTTVVYLFTYKRTKRRRVFRGYVELDIVSAVRHMMRYTLI